MAKIGTNASENWRRRKSWKEFQKHCQRHNGPMELTPYLELSLQLKWMQSVEIIWNTESIPWVRCASGNFFILGCLANMEQSALFLYQEWMIFITDWFRDWGFEPTPYSLRPTVSIFQIYIYIYIYKVCVVHGINNLGSTILVWPELCNVHVL